MTPDVQVNPVDPPYELLLEANAVILGPHVDGKVMLILQEMPGCNQLQLAACLRWNNGSHVAAIRCLALATRNATTPLTVEYLTPAKDASGRFYATQICAQKLPRDLRLLIYGSTHKEVDLTGAHYELIRAMTGSVTLPSYSFPKEQAEGNLVRWAKLPILNCSMRLRCYPYVLSTVGLLVP